MPLAEFVLLSIFLLSLLFVTCTYAGYPLFIFLLAKFWPKQSRRDETLRPSVSIVIAVHNGAEFVSGKLSNLDSLEYDLDKLEIIALDDGSSDQTFRLLGKCAGLIRKRVHRMQHQQGKAVALNCGVELASNEIIVFTDIRQRIEPAAIRNLVRWFADEKIGAVSGSLHIGTGEGPGIYWAYEKMIRRAESAFNSTVGATGALYAIRKSLFSQIPEGCILDDVWLPMKITMSGYRVVFDAEAKVFDAEYNVEREFLRKVRTLGGNFQLIQLAKELLNPFKNRLWFQFMSHKVARLFCPYALVLLLISNVALVFVSANCSPLLAFTLIAQAILYLLAFVGYCFESAGRLRAVRLAHTFVSLNIAAVLGLMKFLRGRLVWV